MPRKRTRGRRGKPSKKNVVTHPGKATASLNGNRLHVLGVFQGELPRKMGPKYARWKGVYIPDECRQFRYSICRAMRVAVRKITKKEPSRLLDVSFEVFTNQTRPDLDTSYHQVQDALSKDMYELDDRYVRSGDMYRLRLGEGEQACFTVEATYEL